jgi:hypothetical protein
MRDYLLKFYSFYERHEPIFTVALIVTLVLSIITD